MRLTFTTFVLAGFMAGCGTPAPVPLGADEMAQVTQFSKLAAAYNQAYQAKKKPLTSAGELKPYLKKSGDDPEVVLTSPRDNKPLVFVSGFDPAVRAPDGQQSIIFYEQEGVGGKRMVVDIRGVVRFVPVNEFAEIKFAGGHKPTLRGA